MSMNSKITMTKNSKKNTLVSIWNAHTSEKQYRQSLSIDVFVSLIIKDFIDMNQIKDLAIEMT